METTGLFFTPETAELDYKTLAASPAPYLSRIKAHSPKSALSTHSKHAIILGRRKQTLGAIDSVEFNQLKQTITDLEKDLQKQTEKTHFLLQIHSDARRGVKS